MNLCDANALKTYNTMTKSYEDVFQFACKNCPVFSPKVNPNDFNLGTATQTTLTIS